MKLFKKSYELIKVHDNVKSTKFDQPISVRLSCNKKLFFVLPENKIRDLWFYVLL